MKLFPEQDLVVPLARSPALVIKDLDAALDRTVFDHIFRDRLIGDAASERIRIRRDPWWWRNDFAPRFTGAVRSDGTAIERAFRLSLWARGFLLVWLGLLLIVFLPTALIGVARDGFGGPRPMMLGMVVALFAFGGWVLPWLGWAIGRSDIARIEAAIRGAAGSVGA